MAGGESLIQTTGHDSTKLGVYKTRFVAVRTYEKLDVTLTKHDLIEMKEVNSLNISITDSLLDFRVTLSLLGLSLDIRIWRLSTSDSDV